MSYHEEFTSRHYVVLVDLHDSFTCIMNRDLELDDLGLENSLQTFSTKRFSSVTLMTRVINSS